MSSTPLLSAMRALTLAAAVLAASALAAPGAHGPNGEHLDAPAPQGSATTAPRLEAKSELFELVATLAGGELSLLVDRFDSNEPVLGAKVEVESGAHKAVARFHADHGDYAVDDAAFLQALGRPGEHPLVITIASGADADLLEGTLRVSAAPAGDHGPGLQSRRALAAGAAVLLAAGAAAVFLFRRRRSSRGVAA
jgi:hypothetical protein